MSRGERPLRRTYGAREERQRFLVYCEGELTEITYFKGIRRELRAATVQIEIGSHHGEPHGLVRRAIAHQRLAPRRARDRFEVYDQVWCVFDVESPQPHPRLDDALHLARRFGVQCAVSNPCFELWLLLHFREQTGHLTTAEACKLLAACPCGYRTTAKQLDYDSLRVHREHASERAERLDVRTATAPTVRDRNPWTSVHALVDALYANA